MPQAAILWTSLRGPIGPVVGRANSQGFTFAANPAGRTWFVDTVNGSDSSNGLTPTSAFATMGRAFFTDSVAVPNLNANDTILFRGKVREQLIAPLLGADGVSLTGVQIGSFALGGVRDDDGAKWTYPASGAVAGQALLSLRQQGWGVSNFLMTPEPNGGGGACIKLNRQENATYPDSSHFVSSGMRYVGIDITTTYGIQDVGGCSAIKSLGDEFYLLTTGIYSSSQAQATPLRWQVIGCRFIQNTNDIVVPASACLFENNTHFTDNTVTMNIAAGATNTIKNNSFPNVAADIDPAHGYTGNATDIWTSNLAKDAVVFGQPA